MTLRIRRDREGKVAIFALSGRLEEQHISELNQLFETEVDVEGFAFDLKEVRLVDRQILRFLADSESRGIELRNCPGYVREWLEAGKDGSHE